MSWTEADLPDLSGRRFVVTGANSGLGWETARALASRGGEVVMACRNPAKAASAADGIRERAPGAKLTLLALDLGDLASVRAASATLLAEGRPIDGLINNAGVMAVPQGRTVDGFEIQFGTNHLGHFAWTAALLGLVQAAPAGRVVTVASSAHHFGWMRWDDLQRSRRYQPWLAYGQSKLSNLLFTYALDRRLRAVESPVRALCAHPGYADTNLQVVAPQQRGSAFEIAAMRLGNRLVAQSAAAGALPTLRAATDADAPSGAYYGPSGWFELRGAPVRVRSNARSHRVEDQDRLWAESVALTGAVWPAWLS
ncbi:MAG: hypothetical protein RLZZ383_2418 [Pseudomonadota bacterium]|jgi:NAD(P)-dependent dehydrogenase (short-subunit alcohol dehydrogenase family)